MSDRLYQWVKPDGTWGMERTKKEVMEVAGERVPRRLKVYRLTKNGDVVRRGERRWVLRGLSRVLDTGDVGDVYRLWGDGEVQFMAREVKPAVQIIDTNGNGKIDKVWSYGKAEFPDVSFLGAYVCKRIAGTYQYSQHSYGNAVDFGRKTMADLWDLARWLVQRADELSLSHVIVDDAIWTRGYGWSHYGGQRHYHVHADCSPNLSGSCGVRG